jgi:hypothetical protein
MVRNIETAPTFDRLFTWNRYWAARLGWIEGPKRDPVLIAEPDADQKPGSRYAAGGFETGRNMLERFARLSDGSVRSVVLFARRFGMLGLCADHGRPSPECRWLTADECEGFSGSERVVDWFRLSREIKTAILLAAKLHRGELPADDDWLPLLDEAGVAKIDPVRGFRRDEMGGGMKMDPPTYWKRSITMDWQVLGLVISSWWASTSLRLVPFFEPDTRVEVRLVPRGLFSVLVRELLFVVTKVEGFAVCAGCGKLFSPKRKPAAGQCSWCGRRDCRKAQLRLAKQKQRAREKA